MKKERKKKREEGGKKKRVQPDSRVFLFYRDVPPCFAREGGWQRYNLNARSDLYLFPPRSRRGHSTNGHASDISKLNLTAENAGKRPRVAAPPATATAPPAAPTARVVARIPSKLRPRIVSELRDNCLAR